MKSPKIIDGQRVKIGICHFLNLTGSAPVFLLSAAQFVILMPERGYFSGGKAPHADEVNLPFFRTPIYFHAARTWDEAWRNLMTDVENHARRVIQIMKDAGVRAGDSWAAERFEAVWFNVDHAEREGLLTALQYARNRDWTEDGGGVFLRRALIQHKPSLVVVSFRWLPIWPGPKKRRLRSLSVPGED
jgi:hypothetical protein